MSHLSPPGRRAQPGSEPGPASEPLAFETDPETTASLAAFGLHARQALREIAGPLEVLTRLVDLARASLHDPTKQREYLDEAEQQAQAVAAAYAALLRACPEPPRRK